MNELTLFTIGFAGKNAHEFFGLLEQAGVRRILDIRRNNVSQLAGFTKRPDLEFFLQRLLAMEYRHLPDLAPDQELLDAYKKKRVGWEEYERRFEELMADRRAEDALSPALADGACLLCSEPTPDRCHRRLVAEYLQRKWGNLRIVHL